MNTRVYGRALIEFSDAALGEFVIEGGRLVCLVTVYLGDYSGNVKFRLDPLEFGFKTGKAARRQCHKLLRTASKAIAKQMVASSPEATP